jgi:ribose transport system substrate-binding protein
MTGVFRSGVHARFALASGAILTASVLAAGAVPVAAQDEEVACDPTEGGKTYAYIKPGPDTWYQRDVDGFRFAAEADGNTVIEYDTAYDAEKELQNIANAVNEQVDGISMFSSTEAGATAAAVAGNEAGIPVVLTDSVGTVIANGTDHVASIDFDWVGMGESYAEWMAETYPGERFYILTGIFGSPPSEKINEGMTTKAEELGVNELVGIQETGYSPDNAAQLAQDLLYSGEEFGLLFVMDEDMASAVIRMLRNEGALNNPIKVFAQNGDPDAGIPLLEEGSLQYTISSSPGWEGFVAYHALNNYVSGCTDEINRQIMLPVIEVTSENMDDPTQVVPWVPDEIYWELTEQHYPDLVAGR